MPKDIGMINIAKEVDNLSIDDILNTCKKAQDFYANGIDYVFYSLPDNWIAIFYYQYGAGLKPLIQAKDLEHAKSYCVLREVCSVPLKRLIED